MVTLSNKEITLQVAEKGAEMISLRQKASGREYLWQGDPAYWKWHAPICFPIVGSLPEDTYEWQGKKYHLTVHGFARDETFRLAECNNQSLLFTLEDNEDSFTKYPFHFRLSIGYALVGNHLRVSYEVENRDTQEMPFSIGAHTAFRCQLDQGNQLVFDPEEHLERSCVTGGFLDGRKKYLPSSDGRVLLTQKLFADDVLIFRHLKNRRVSLIEDSGKEIVRVDASEFPYMGFWTKPSGAPFVCIEPWFGVTDSIKHLPFAEKEGMQHLLPGEVFHHSYEITLS